MVQNETFFIKLLVYFSPPFFSISIEPHTSIYTIFKILCIEITADLASLDLVSFQAAQAEEDS